MMICDESGHSITDGVQPEIARATAQRLANERGESVWLSESDSEDMGERFDPSGSNDVHVIERESLGEEYTAAFDLPWLVQWADGTIQQFSTEEEACACQREWRESIGINPITGRN